MASVYDRTDIYDLLENEDRYRTIKRHWEKVLDGRKVHTLLDVSIGTGNLTLPLAEMGIRLYGSDLSEEMLKKCKEKAVQKGFAVHLGKGQAGWEKGFGTEEGRSAIDLRVSDFRELSGNFQEKFDCVASTGNSLPHVENGDVLKALEQMDLLVKPGGYLYYDMRNWDRILRERNRFYLYNPVFDGDVRINMLQVWDYHADDSMTFNLLYTFEKENTIFQKEKFAEHYFPVKRELLLDKLRDLGYEEITVMPHPACFDGADAEQAEWYCVMAEKI